MGRVTTKLETVLTEPIVVPGKPLGRNLNHDPRSLRFPFKASSVVLTDAVHTSHIPILDQGNLGSCTGNAIVGTLGCSPYYETLSDSQQLMLTENLAVKLYSTATGLDPFPGVYPPTDTGSDGLSVAKAAKDAGYISGYTHAFSLNDALAALVLGPVIIGINWYEGFDNPDGTGRIAVGGQVRGGHEVCLWRIEAANKRVWLKNSWSADWGIDGTAWFSFDDFGRLLNEDGDCTVVVPLTAPAPTPIPVPPSPEADQADAKLWSPATKAWAAARHVGSNKAAAKAVTEWAKTKGL